MKQRVFNNEIIRLNAPSSWYADIYYRLVRLSWPLLILEAFLAYIGINLIFASVYYLHREGLAPPPNSFLECFFFSIHTFSTVGYGSIAPQSLAVHATTVVETFTGLVSTALLTGLFYSKFSQPTARFIFSKNILLTKHAGKEVLMYRVANTRSNRVMDAELSLSALYSEVTPEGITYRKLYDLPLERSKTPIFALSFTCVYEVEKGSRAEHLIQMAKNGENVEFVASVRGLDDTFGQTIHSMHIYSAKDLNIGGQFVDILSINDNGTRTIDFAKFHNVKN